MPTIDPVIQIEDVHKSFDVPVPGQTTWQRLRKVTEKREVLKGVSATVNKGNVVVLLGSSGSGKSTLLRCINRLETIDSGRIRVNGSVIGKTSYNGIEVEANSRALARQRAEVGMVFQQFNLFPNKTALHNIIDPLTTVRKLSKDEARTVAEEQLVLVGLADRMHSYPSALSGGQQQRVAIARAMAMKPSALLFDEPTSALDPELVGEVLSVIRTIAERGTTLVIVTHEMSFARDIASEIIVMDSGVIVESGPPHEIFSRPQHPKTQALLRRHQAEL